MEQLPRLIPRTRPEGVPRFNDQPGPPLFIDPFRGGDVEPSDEEILAEVRTNDEGGRDTAYELGLVHVPGGEI